ncbi:hypothetical protein FRC08_014551 [Ceratobasidium sp. 394]|nr:hypothetical protein FRC08_014551 [Ceratobasidium sp. 394]
MPEQLVHSYLENNTPVRLQCPTDTTLKKTHPFLVHTGWAKHIKELDTVFPCVLLDVPTRDHSLHRLYEAAIWEFKQEQDISQRPTRVVDEPHGRRHWISLPPLSGPAVPHSR